MTSDPRTGTDAREAARAAVLRSREAHRMSYASVARDDQPEQYRCVCGDAHSGPGSLAKGRHHDAVTSADAVLAALAAVPAPTDEGRAGHAIEWTIEPFGFSPTATVSCYEPPTARCRMWCDEGCEERCLDETTHRWVPIEVCNVVEWLNADGPGDCYVGEAQPLVNGPIEPEWNGDSYSWHYAAAAAPVPAPATDGPPSAPTGEGTDTP